MEMRTSLEADKKQAVEKIVHKYELEKQKCVDEAKKKQWVCIQYKEYCAYYFHVRRRH